MAELVESFNYACVTDRGSGRVSLVRPILVGAVGWHRRSVARPTYHCKSDPIATSPRPSRSAQGRKRALCGLNTSGESVSRRSTIPGFTSSANAHNTVPAMISNKPSRWRVNQAEMLLAVSIIRPNRAWRVRSFFPLRDCPLQFQVRVVLKLVSS